jgi:uncharacterized membrane protein
MLSFFLWYLLISILGWLTFPLAYRLLPALADRGYAITRTMGLLLWGFIFWLLAVLGILHNDTGGLLFSLLVLVAISAWALRSAGLDEFRAWLQSHLKLIVSVELLFLAAFAGWAVVRAANPDIFGTEKPMELAFINSILRSPVFPPHDPWLSGYAISYYYFGYVLVAMLAMMTGITGGVAFNLGIALIFALSALGAYGMVFNLLSIRRGGILAYNPSNPSNVVDPPEDARQSNSYFLPLLGPLFILLVSNAEGFLEVLHARGVFPASFWKWLDIMDINQPPVAPFSWLPRLFGTGNWWWWRASRVVQDYDFLHNPKEIIDEFPFFSYLLADLHPHVLAMPFAFLAMTLALNIFLGGGRSLFNRLHLRLEIRWLAWIALILVLAGLAFLWVGLGSLSLKLSLLGIIGMVIGGFALVGIRPPGAGSLFDLFTRDDLGEADLGFTLLLDAPTLLLAAVVLGGLAFLNTWDFPFYLALVAGAYVLRRILESHGIYSLGTGVRDFAAIGLVLGVSGGLLYLPFYLGFSSQAGGILPDLIYPTRGAQLWVMFATLLLPLIAYLFYLWSANRASAGMRTGFALAFGFTFLLWILSLLLGLGIIALPGVGNYYLSTLAAPDSASLFRQAISRRLVDSGGWITLVLLLGVTLGLLFRLVKARTEQEDPEAAGKLSFTLSPSHLFALLLALLGILLVLGPDFFYLRDQFGWRINTIFKFYYQAWLLWGIAGAFGAAFLIQKLRSAWGLVFRFGLGLVLVVGLTYTSLGLLDKTHGFDPTQGFTLDGTAYLDLQSPDEMAAVRWLRSAPLGVVVEAVSPTGGSYSNYAQIAELSGLPDVLGWMGHESQWRGGSLEMGSRQSDLQRLYCTKNWDEAQSIINRYDIRYIYIGDLERSTYTSESCSTGLYEPKFSRYLRTVFKQGSVTIFEVP